MPPSNSPTDTPIQTHSPLPSLIYFYPPATTSGGEGPPGNPTSQPQPPTGADIFPRATLNQTLLPQPPSHNVSLYGQLPPLQSTGPRRAGYAPRRITLRDLEPRLSTTERDLEQAYGPRIPSLLPGQRQSLYDWAPAQAGPGPMYFAGSSVEAPNASARREIDDDTGPLFRRMRDSSPPLAALPTPPSAPAIVPATAPASARLRSMNADGGRDRRAQLDNGSNRPFSTAASLRRYMRGQPQRSRNIWAGYAADAERERERARQRDRDRELREIDDAIDAAWVPVRGAGSSGVGVGHNRATTTTRRNSVVREYNPCKDLEETLKYLEKLRRCNSIGESLKLALASGFTRDTAWLSYDGCDCSFDDFLLDTRMLKAVKTSWLDIGGTFWGSQTTLASSGSTNLASEAYSPNKWTVKVNISGIDYGNLKLNGTMEAYADWEKHAENHNHNHTNSHTNTQTFAPSTPDKSLTNPSSSAQSANSSSSSKDTMTPIITYLEGEIIDFRMHTLQTTSYTSTLSDDALYWQKLEPFSYYEPETLIPLLTSKMFLEKLMGEYVLMRWKEKCFIKGGAGGVSTGGLESGDDDGEDGVGVGMGGGGLLTIGGFYFVSMRRSDGAVRGFYYDPKSTPYQELVLKPKKRVFPTYDFR